LLEVRLANIANRPVNSCRSRRWSRRNTQGLGGATGRNPRARDR
jgi:hypothetical protein